ncbi:MAG: Wzz/FepE/Etk N-terminal domain-containing protein [Oscillospiraceae bacterium]|nr:Wzz/FepE/Etk N-terminal domain-containing protein [Oscillospiraceae bacterium]
MNDEILEINLTQIFKALWHRLWAIILAAVIAGGALFSYAAFFVTPLYEAQALLYVNNSSFSLGSTSFSISSSELTAAQSLVDTYIVILKTRTTLNEVIEKAGVDYSYEELSEMIASEPVNNTEVFSIKVTSDSPQEAESIANTIAEILPNKIADIVDGSSVRVVDYAVVPAEKASPNITLFTAIGVLIGIVLACMLIIIREMMDTQIHSEDYLIQTYKLPVLAVIPDLFDSNSAGYYAAYESSNPAKKG